MEVPKEVAFTFLTNKIFEQVKAINAAVLPMGYTDESYNEFLKAGEKYTKIALYNDVAVGAICSKLEDAEDKKKKVYIASIAVLAPYRGLGIGTKLLSDVCSNAAKDPKITEIYLHIQAGDSKALTFYKNMGFEEKERLEGYYKRLEPSTAILLRRDCSGGDQE